ncbi:MAG: amidohydrolase family protein, partial [Chloroflexota bacterium]
MTSTLNRTLMIDADSHYFPQLDFDEMRRLLTSRGYGPEEVNMILRDASTFTGQGARRGGFSRTAQGARVGASDTSDQRGGGGQAVGMGDVEERANLMAETGFDQQVLIPDGVFANMFWSPIGRKTGALEEGVRLALSIGFNNAVAAAQRQRPDRFIGTAILPIPDVAASCEEATRAVKELGLKAITLQGNWMGTNWDALELYPFWRTASDLGATIFVHHVPFQDRK